MTLLLVLAWFGSLVLVYVIGWNDAKDDSEVEEMLANLKRRGDVGMSNRFENMTDEELVDEALHRVWRMMDSPEPARLIRAELLRRIKKEKP